MFVQTSNCSQRSAVAQRRRAPEQRPRACPFAEKAGPSPESRPNVRWWLPPHPCPPMLPEAEFT